MCDVNLKAMCKLHEEFGIRTGYSDHTVGIEIPLAAVALGATVIEKHFTLDRCMEGPDHKASLEPSELKQMVSAIRNVEEAWAGKRKLYLYQNPGIVLSPARVLLPRGISERENR